MQQGPTTHSAMSGRLRWEELDVQAGPGAMLDALAAQPLPAMLDSSALDARYGRYSILACRPVEGFRTAQDPRADLTGQ